MFMHDIKLEHNDDAGLDPADPQCIMRGSLFIDGHEAGSWEARRDGSWAAHLRHEQGWVVEQRKNALIERLKRDA
jgi:hypothetical protein